MRDGSEGPEDTQAKSLGELLFPDVPPEPLRVPEQVEPAARPRRRQVMISYASEDKRVADDLCASIEAHGVFCWIAPRDVEDGEVYGAAIDRAIQDAKALVVVLSVDSNGSRHVLSEIASAFDAGLEILALKIDDVVPSHAVAYYLRTVHWEIVDTASLYRHYLAVSDRLKTLL